MATVTGITAEKAQEIIDDTIVDADVIGDNLILIKHDGSTVDAGNVRGPIGPSGGDPEAWHYIGDVGEPAFLNGWVQGADMPAYRKDRDRVQLRGSLNAAGATSDTAFQLPAGYRPVQSTIIPVTGRTVTPNHNVLFLYVEAATGNVRVQDNNAAKAPAANINIYLGGISIALS